MPKRKGIRLAKPFHVIYGNNVTSVQLIVGNVYTRSRNGALSRKGCVVNGQMS